MANEEHTYTLGHDLRITNVERGLSGIGTWVSGTVNGHFFQAKIFPKHSPNQDWEIGRSRISKLGLKRLEDDRVVFHWDRGAEKLPKDPLGKERDTIATVDLLTTGALDRFGRNYDRDCREVRKS